MIAAPRTTGLPTLYRVDMPDANGHWHKVHARPFKTRAPAEREMARHARARLMAKYPGAWGWHQVFVQGASNEEKTKDQP